jgi:tRNA-splicing endonuclease subunit Sen34
MTSTPDLPLAISLIGSRYFLFSADEVEYLRREHHICGVLTGSIPQIPQQNVFLGLPLELMPEEVLLLVTKEVAYIVDDVRAHDEGVRNLGKARRQDYLASLRQAGEKAAKSQAESRGQKREQALKKRGLTPPCRSEDAAEKKSEEAPGGEGIFEGNDSTAHIPCSQEDIDETDSLFTLSPPTPTPSNPTKPKPSPLALTPTTSHLLLPPPPPLLPRGQPPITHPPSYPLFAHLHSKGYFLSPGLRFGCQYVVYPGDPLRFHSHFLAVAVDWEQEIDLMELVGGGRLGTGVKKGFLIGGKEPSENSEEEGQEEGVRTLSVEWAVM